MKAIKKVSLIFLSALFLVGLGGYILFPKITHCLALPYSSFVKYPGQVYISPQMPKSLHPKILSLLNESRQRLKGFWGGQIARPRLVFCATEAEFAFYGTNYHTPAMVNLTPWGAFIIIKPDGVNVDVISHEICHAELFARLGWYTKVNKVPAWFDEGLALRLDYRYPGSKRGNTFQDYQTVWLAHTASGKEPIQLQELDKIDSFFREDDDQWTNFAYLSAGRELAMWYEKVGQRGLLELVIGLKNGESFSNLYQSIFTKQRQEVPK